MQSTPANMHAHPQGAATSWDVLSLERPSCQCCYRQSPCYETHRLLCYRFLGVCLQFIVSLSSLLLSVILLVSLLLVLSLCCLYETHHLFVGGGGRTLREKEI